MENISILDLQNLSNLLWEEQSVSLRNQLQAWVESKTTNNDHADLSSLHSLADRSTIKSKIKEWAASISEPKKEYIYIPDIPEQIAEFEPLESLEIELPAEELTVKPKKIQKKKS